MFPDLDLHPLVRDWFTARFQAPTPAQARAWPHVARGDSLLLCAPTGSGKTLAAFLLCIDRLIRRALAGTLPDATQVVYVSPLKALSNDVHRNLQAPLAELAALAGTRGVPLPELRAAVRTGDTTAGERRLHARRPPHILVTTPESLYVLLTSDSGRRGLRGADTLILDELHAVVADKRGAHLALSAERLEALCGRPLQRIGLSATVRPLEVAAQFLSGERAPPVIVDASAPRGLDLRIESPRDELGATATGPQWEELYERITELARAHRTTLVFVNTRRLVERVAHNLAARLGEDAVGAHHGSLSRQRRFQTEQRLKSGELKVVVATASLELGIDVGAVELVCLVGSPRTIATGLQRIGRAGHAVGGTPRARIFPQTRDQLIECAALVHAARQGELEALAPCPGPLDILAQQIVAACACEVWDEDALFGLLRRAAPYRALARAQFDAVVDMLADGVATARGRAGALLHRDAVGRTLRARRGARLIALTSGGAIPDTALYDVVEAPADTFVGTLDEDFAIESMAGDIVLLGNTSWRILRVESGRVRVESAAGLPPTVPFWFGEGPARSFELSRAVAALRARIAAALAEPTADPAARDRDLRAWLVEDCALDPAGAELAVRYVAAGHAALGAVPTQACVIAERFFDEAGGTQIVIHAPFGGRINRAWGTALRKRFCRTFDFELQAAATDEGILLSLGPQHSFPLETILAMVHPDAVDELLTQAALQSPLFETRWRWNATRALAIPRQRGGKRVPPHLLRMRAQDLLAACFPAQVGCQDNHGGGPIEVPPHPLVQQTVRDCLSEPMDGDGLRAVLVGLHDGRIRGLARETPEPSVFAHEILNANPYAFLDDAPLEERRARAVAVRRGLPAELADTLGRLDPAALAQVCAQARPRVRDADELHDLLLELGALPEDDACALRAHEDDAGPPPPDAQATARARAWLDELIAARRATRLRLDDGRIHWVAAERLGLARLIWPDARIDPDLAAPPARGTTRWHDRDAAIAELVRGHLGASPPLTAATLAARLGLARADAEAALVAVETEGQVLRGRFSSAPSGGAPEPRTAAPGDAADLEWFDRRLLARASRRTVDGLRRQLAPCSAADLLRFLLAWQHLAPGTQLHGRDGLREIIGQLQGFEAAASAWEQELLPARLAGYDPAWLDELCLGGELAWGRLHTRREALRAPTRAAPITICQRASLPWLLEPELPESAREPEPRPAPAPLSPRAADVAEYLHAAGASFLDDIVAGTGRLRSEVEDALWELVAAGHVTGDGFAPLRALLSPARRVGRLRWYGSARRAPARPLAGRWALLRRSTPRVDDGERTAALARQYLRRYGVVFRELLAREPCAPPWRELVRVLRALELRGEVRGGRLVSGFVGEQFALPEALERLRALRGAPPDMIRVRVPACDPLNVAGILTPGARVPAQLGKQVTYVNGVPEADTGAAPRSAQSVA